MSIWQHLFVDDFEYAPAAEILTDLPLGAVGERLGNAHTIFEELYHVTVWQRSMVASAAGGDPVAPDPAWPTEAAPQDEAAWRALVEDFLAGARRAADLGEDASRHDTVLPEGRTVRERLELLAVHNAHHLGKILALRQAMNLWPAARTEAGA